MDLVGGFFCNGYPSMPYMGRYPLLVRVTILIPVIGDALQTMTLKTTCLRLLTNSPSTMLALIFHHKINTPVEKQRRSLTEAQLAFFWTHCQPWYNMPVDNSGLT